MCSTIVYPISTESVVSRIIHPPPYSSRVLKEETCLTKIHHLSALIAVTALLALSGPAPAAAQNAPAATPGVVRHVQTVLRNAGAYNVTVNGREDSATKVALRRWQRDRGIHPTGIVDTATLQSMHMR
jgi:Putative peptidoglycan binding domain